MQDIIDRLEAVLRRMSKRNAELEKSLKHKPVSEMTVLELIETVEQSTLDMVE